MLWGNVRLENTLGPLLLLVVVELLLDLEFSAPVSAIWRPEIFLGQKQLKTFTLFYWISNSIIVNANPALVYRPGKAIQ